MTKILITGTGRCGTTFLIKLFTFLGFDTGFTKENFQHFIFENCNAGMEKPIISEHKFLKNPLFIENIEEIVNKYKIELVIIPVRNYEKSAISRVRHENNCGGLWNADNYDNQLVFFHKIIANYLYCMTKYEIPTIFLDFDKMTNQPYYLYEKLGSIFKKNSINYSFYLKEYNFASETSKPKQKETESIDNIIIQNETESIDNNTTI